MTNLHLIIQMVKVDGPTQIYYFAACPMAEDKIGKSFNSTFLPTEVTCPRCRKTPQFEQLAIEYELSNLNHMDFHVHIYKRRRQEEISFANLDHLHQTSWVKHTTFRIH